eukprot:gene11663-biopygen6380
MQLHPAFFAAPLQRVARQPRRRSCSHTHGQGDQEHTIIETGYSEFHASTRRARQVEAKQQNSWHFPENTEQNGASQNSIGKHCTARGKHGTAPKNTDRNHMEQHSARGNTRQHGETRDN